MRPVNDSQLIDLLGGTSALAAHVRVSQASVSQWRKDGIPELRLIELGATIERVAGIRRWHLRPDDWHRIWPELVGAEGAPPVPTPAEV
jgi:DNA-binding transcriptional regulator YdaS (Cro superfamily)